MIWFGVYSLFFFCLGIWDMNWGEGNMNNLLLMLFINFFFLKKIDLLFKIEISRVFIVRLRYYVFNLGLVSIYFKEN